MEKALQDPLEINLKEWEFLPDNTAFLELGLENVKDLLSNEIVYTDYFREEPKLIQQTPSNHNQEEESQFKDISISHVFFKMIEPKGEELIECTRPSFDTKQSAVELFVQEIEPSPQAFVTEDKGIPREVEKEEEKPIWEGISIRIWRWRLMGVGALFSIGAAAAAATICVLVLGGREGKQPSGGRRHQNNLLQFYIHCDNKSARIQSLENGCVVKGASQYSLAVVTITQWYHSICVFLILMVSIYMSLH